MSFDIAKFIPGIIKNIVFSTKLKIFFISNKKRLLKPIETIFIIYILINLFPGDIYSDTIKAYAVNPYDFDISQTSTQTIDLKKAILMVIANNTTVNRSKLDIKKSILPVYNYHANFNWLLYTYAQTYKSVLPINALNFLSGNKISQDSAGAGVERVFQKGTYLNLEASTLRFDNNAFENSQISPLFKQLAIPPLYTGAVKMMISQELLKNSFGLNHTNTIKILKLNATTAVESMILQLTGLVADTLVKYWMLEVYDASIDTFIELTNNTIELQTITQRKIPLGIAEPFELNRWNSLVINSENQLANTRLMKENAERDLYRILNTDPRTKIQGVTELVETLPDLNLENDINYAIESRIDLKLLEKEKEILILTKSNIEQQSLPSMRVSLSYATIGQNTSTPLLNYTDTSDRIFSLNYPDIRGQFNFIYPLSDIENETNMRNTDLKLQENQKNSADLKKQIKDEMTLRYEKINSDYKLYQESKDVAKEAEMFYQKLLIKYKSGKYSSEHVKAALDFLAQAKMAVIQTKVNFNVSILLYDLSKNYIFQRHGIDIRSFIDIQKHSL